MQNAFEQFKDNIRQAKELNDLYTYLKETCRLPNDLSDLLRAEWVYCVSAMDKLIHELVRIGMIEAFQGRRNRTNKFITFGVSTNTLTSVLSAEIPPPEYWFEQEIIIKHKVLAFQAPDKIGDALSLIWEDPHKWQKLAIQVGIEEQTLKTKLKAIVNRRNLIVHEADFNVLTGRRTDIEKDEVLEVVELIEKISEAIFISVKLN